MLKLFGSSLAVCALIGLAPLNSARATLIGDNVTLNIPDVIGTPTSTVAADAPVDFGPLSDGSFANGNPIFSWTVDIQGTLGDVIEIRALVNESSGAGFQRIVTLSDIDFKVVSAVLLSNSFDEAADPLPGSVSFTDNSVTFDTNNFGQTVGIGSSMVARIQIVQISEPAALGILGIGFALLGLRRRWKCR